MSENMEITEKERLMLEKERDEIRKLTLEILELENDPKNSTEIKKHVIGIQFSINRMATYSNTENYKLDAVTKIVQPLLTLLSSNPPEEVQKEMETLIHKPSDELIKGLKRLKIKREQLRKMPLNVAYPAWWGYVVDGLDKYCCYVNSIRFDFTKKGLKMVLPATEDAKRKRVGFYISTAITIVAIIVAILAWVFPRRA